ncbi:MAG: hypothetical protein IPP47_07615 [Bryobacterales bacterium]|nr:hypothetical protein [Bryobacterales bacterium]
MTIIIDKVGIVIADPSGKGRLLPGDYWHVAARPDGKKLVADDSRATSRLIDAATDSRRLLATGVAGTLFAPSMPTLPLIAPAATSSSTPAAPARPSR